MLLSRFNLPHLSFVADSVLSCYMTLLICALLCKGNPSFVCLSSSLFYFSLPDIPQPWSFITLLVIFPLFWHPAQQTSAHGECCPLLMLTCLREGRPPALWGGVTTPLSVVIVMLLLDSRQGQDEACLPSLGSCWVTGNCTLGTFCSLKHLVHLSTQSCSYSAELYYIFASHHDPSFSLLQFQALLLGSLITTNTEDYQGF